MSHQDATVQDTDIAIIGMAGRFPGANDVDAFWANVRDGVESIVAFDDDALRARGVTDSELADPDYVKAGAFLADVDQFDAAFFGYSPREAEEMDPQHRLFLEASWQALEHAGYDAGSWPQPIGVYGGTGVNTYLLLHLMPSGRFSDMRDISSLQGLMNGNNKDSMCTTVSYKLNLRGPGVTVQTACSTSLAAVHMASRGLLNHEADMAVAGGVWVNLLHEGGYRHQAGAILSPDGHCRAFDEQAAGTVIGSGVGVVVLKRLADALAEGDTIHAVIKGSALNNDGSAKVGYTAPSVAGQAEVIMTAQAMADVPAESITYIEAHGTGTTMGDPVEIAALTQAFRADTDKRGFCGVGSVKTNVGHLDAAAGVTGLIKTAQALKHRILPPSLHFKQPNPRIDFDNSPFYVNATRQDWPEGATPRRAGVSSFGIGGTNVHVIVQEPPRQSAAAQRRGWCLLPVSARTPSALDAAMARLNAHVQAQPEQSLADVAYTLQVGRKRFARRAFALCQHQAHGAVELGLGDRKRWFVAADVTPDGADVAFMFPGQGAQHVGMAQGLYQTEPVFRAEFDRCADGLKGHLPIDLRALVYPEGDDAARQAAAAQLSMTQFTQPALFAIEYALARLWMSWGVQPQAMIGHSIGEYVAASLAGVFSLDDALHLVAARGRLIQALPGGAMLSVNLSEAELAPYLARHGCDLAAVNGPARCVLAGTAEAISSIEADLAAGRDVAVQRLHVSHAFHSSMVEPACEALRALVARMPRQAPTLPFLSNVTGRWITAQEATDPDYWARHLRATVRFADGLHELLSDPTRVLLEVGPGDTLTQLAQRHPDARPGRTMVSSLPHPQRAYLAPDHLPTTLGRLWLAGVDIDWAALHKGERRLRVPLPTYPFERQSYWVPRGDMKASGTAPRTGSHKVGDLVRGMDDWFHAPSWQRADALPGARTDAPSASTGCTLIFADTQSAASRLAADFDPSHGPIVIVATGNRFAKQGALRYEIRPGDQGDMQQLLKAVREEIGAVATVFHLCSLINEPGEPSWQDIQARGFFSVMHLVQALDAAQPSAPVNLVIATNQLEDVTGHEVLNPAQGTLAGLCQVIEQEHPNLSCRLVDIDLKSTAHWVERLAMEASAPKASPAVVAYRGAHRWVQCFMPIQRDAPVASPLRAEGVYVLTGGLGGIGLALAEHFARTVQARLVLVGRSSPTPQQLEKIERLRVLGAQVLTVQADLSKADETRAMLAKARTHFGVIHGVVHAAGDAGGGVIAGKTADQVEKVFAAKVAGTQALMAALSGEPLNFLVLCSSLSTIAGGLGKADYAAANAYLDAVARLAARQSAFPVVAINWDSWRDVGMAGHMAMPDGVGITPRDGALALERILAGPPLPQVIVSTLDLAQRLAHAGGNLLDQPLATEGAGRASGHARPALSTAYEAPQDDLQEGIAEVWRTMLGIADIGIHDNLFELGGDSLLGIQILSRVRARFSVELHPAAFFKQPTVAALAVLIETQLINEIERAA